MQNWLETNSVANIAISLIFRIRKFPVLSLYFGKIPCVFPVFSLTGNFWAMLGVAGSDI